MATYVTNRDSGGLTDEKGHLKFLANSYTGNILDGMQVVESSPTGMSVRVSAGNIRIPYSNYAYMGWSEGYTGVSVATADPSNPRIDRVVAYVDRSMTFTDSDTNNPNSLKFKAVTGTPNAVPSKPSDGAVDSSVGATNPWIEIGLVTVPAAVSMIVAANITDARTYIAPVYQTDWKTFPSAISSVTNNGNRSYTFNTSGDESGNISPGARLRTSRTVPAPMMSASLNGTNQYFSKTSPSGMTFTDDFVVSAWVKLSSYPVSGISVVAGRFNGTSGWRLEVATTGVLSLYGLNGGAGNYSGVISYQSLPLNRWVHITAQLDMSSFTATTTTSYIMIDGVDVPASVYRGGTNPTSLTQAGNFEIGSMNSGASLLNGKIAQVAIYSAKVTQATMRGYISQGLTGTETSLVSAYSLSNSLTDLNTTNANNLSAQGSATTVNADAPWGQQSNGTISPTVDYAIVQSINGTSVTVQVPEGCTLPTSGGISSASYSTAKAPYGMPVQTAKWQIETINRDVPVTLSTSYVPALRQSVIPIGEWNLSLTVSIEANYSGAGAVDYALSTSTSAITDINLMASRYQGTGQHLIIPSFVSSKVSLSAQTIYYAIIRGNGQGVSMRGDGMPTRITAENAYL